MSSTSTPAKPRDTSVAVAARKARARERRFAAYITEMRDAGYAVTVTDGTGGPALHFRA